MGLLEKALSILKKEKAPPKESPPPPEKKALDPDTLLKKFYQEGEILKEELLQSPINLYPEERRETLPISYVLLHQEKIHSLINLIEFIKQIVYISSEEELYQEILYEILSQLGVKECAIYLKNPQKGTYELKGSLGKTLPEEFHTYKGEIFLELLQKEKSLHYLPPIRKKLSSYEEKFLQEFPAEVLAPLLKKEEVIGFLLVGKPLGEEDFSLTDLLYIKLLGEVLGSLEEVFFLISQRDLEKRIQERRKEKHLFLLRFLKNPSQESFQEALKIGFRISIYG